MIDRSMDLKCEQASPRYPSLDCLAFDANVIIGQAASELGDDESKLKGRKNGIENDVNRFNGFCFCACDLGTAPSGPDRGLLNPQD